MEKKLLLVSDLGGKQTALDKCKMIILDDMKNESNCLIQSWDGKPCDVTAEEHFNNIVEWCKTHFKNIAWSHHKSSKLFYSTSYGFKHNCERDLKCYVANNWMKMAMICAGLEVCNCKYVDYETGRVEKTPILLSDILTNSINFIVRKPRKPINIEYMIADWTYELKYT